MRIFQEFVSRKASGLPASSIIPKISSLFITTGSLILKLKKPYFSPQPKVGASKRGAEKNLPALFPSASPRLCGKLQLILS